MTTGYRNKYPGDEQWAELCAAHTANEICAILEVSRTAVDNWGNRTLVRPRREAPGRKPGWTPPAYDVPRGEMPATSGGELRYLGRS